MKRKRKKSSKTTKLYASQEITDNLNPYAMIRWNKKEEHKQTCTCVFISTCIYGQWFDLHRSAYSEQLTNLSYLASASLSLHTLFAVLVLQTCSISFCAYEQSQDYHGLFTSQSIYKGLSRLLRLFVLILFQLCWSHDVCPKNFALVCLFLLIISIRHHICDYHHSLHYP